jgi:uncharacterized delta-60 repeat protein
LTNRSRISVLAAAAAVALATLSLASAAGGGALDPSFGEGGKVVTDLGERVDTYSVAIQPGGGIVLLGNVVLLRPDGSIVPGRGGLISRPVLIRYRSDGTLDAGFGEGGHTKVVHGDEFVEGAFRALALQNDGGIVVGGSVNGDFALVRHRGDGSLDATFGNGGIVTTDLGAQDEVASVLVQPDGKIIGIGRSQRITVSSRGETIEAPQLALVRFHVDGSVDRSFGDGGRQLLDVGAYAHAAALAPGGEIVVTGSRSEQGTLVLARLTARGRRDPSFSRDGLVNGRPVRADPGWHRVAVQRDGKIVVIAPRADGNVFGLVRFQADGSRDPTFGVGVAIELADLPVRAIYALALDSSGRIVVVGAGTTGFASFVAMRLTPAGRLDPSFGDGGIVTTGFGRRHEVVRAVALQPDGKIVAAGWAGDHQFPVGGGFALARYLPGTCVVPDVARETLAAAGSALERAGCVLDRTAYAPSRRVPRGRVISQSPAPGTELADDVRVALVVTRGPRP